MRKLIFFIITLLLLFVGHHHHHVKANENERNNQHVRHRVLTTKQTNSGTIKCVDLADFYYETILAVSSYPSQASCTEQEQAEIASFLQDKVNAELDALPGTIETQNKICNSTINNRRRRSLWETTSSRLLYESSSSSTRRFLFQSFIYTGGGRCRYCFFDNNDKRNLLLNAVDPTFKKQQFPARPALLEQQEQKEDRDLMYLPVTKRFHGQFDTVADVSLCKVWTPSQLDLYEGVSAKEAKKKKYITWTNDKWSSVTMKANAERKTEKQQKLVGKDINTKKYVLGPYGPGDQFGVQISVESFENVFRQQIKQEEQQKNKKVEVVEEPVAAGIIGIGFWAFDVPLDVPDDMLADEPLYLYINGIKLDLNLLLSQGTNKENGPEMAYGNSFAGIQWGFDRTYNSDCAFGPLPDRYYYISIDAPLVVFAHKNQLDVDLFIKPGARASHYAISRIETYLLSIKCEVTGMDNSPFEDFKSVAESRLFHKLGLGLAHEFQSKQGHCLYDKIPIVNVNLVEKENLMDANPQCD